MIFEIKKFPEKILKEKCREIKVIDKKVKELAVNMIETMKKNNGLGLAAPQVGKNWRVFVCGFNNNYLIFINPKILKKRGKQIVEEGCLSLPGLFCKIKRAREVEIEAVDLENRKINYQAKDLFAQIIQHEIDHLNGVLIIDHLPWWKKISAKKKIKQTEKVRD